jgi:hypothetical protein
MPAQHAAQGSPAVTGKTEKKETANVESTKPVASNSKSEVLPSKEGTAASHKMTHRHRVVTGKTEKKGTANVESTKPVASNSKSEVLPSKEGMPAQHAAQGSPAVTGKTEKKETASVTTTANSREKKAEQKPNETQTTTNPTK